MLYIYTYMCVYKSDRWAIILKQYNTTKVHVIPNYCHFIHISQDSIELSNQLQSIYTLSFELGV